MRSTISSLGWAVLAWVVGLQAAGCLPSPASKLRGTWKGNLAEDLAGALGKESGLEVAYTMTFEEGGKLRLATSFLGEEKSLEGTWKVVGGGGDSVLVSATLGDPREEEQANLDIKFLGPDTITLTMKAGAPRPGGPKGGGAKQVTLKLRRVK